ncbi:helix-turn-helix domain-containing protein [Larkinella rosea]|uniref:DNA-binding protein n=1 Tax=Larkinella rosea TaxID=2025312 RepID=A0A3P1C185_9BACT|nr:helix-turn-helix domain-containing protein [Larkinella rosea]RRB06833.1 DNA-binding protein [Larkinella rosea]
MNVELVTKTELEGLVRNLETLIRRATRNTHGGEQAVYDNEALCKKLKLSKRTLQNWRDEGLIEFSQIGHKIYYTEKAVNQMLEKSKVKCFNNNYNGR